MSKTHVLVTGAAGFIGRALVDRFSESGCTVSALVRSRHQIELFPQSVNVVVCKDLANDKSYSNLLREVDTVVHAAARTHVMSRSDADLDELYRHSNVHATSVLAKAAASAGVKRFVFLSSVKVHGEGGKEAYNESSLLQPQDRYGSSKLEAEISLQKIASQNEMSYVIIRPPLVYGIGVKGNFAALIRLVRRQLPIPLGAVNNKRSFIALGNLVDFVNLCSFSPQAADEIFLVADEKTISTKQLLKEIAVSEGVKSRLFPVPPIVLKFFASLLGKTSQSERLLGTLIVDTSKAKKLLGWEPQTALHEALREYDRSEEGQ